jgi:transposase
VPEADKHCACGQVKTRIGASVSEKLEYVPASLRVIETARLKYACPHCHAGVVEAPAPPQAVEKSLAAEGLLAHVVVSKYVDHLPLYRLERSFLRQGVDLSRSTLCGWVADVATALAPIGDELRRQVSAATYLQTDDTPITILEPAGGSRKGRLWTYLDPIGRQVVFDATPTHERDGPAALLATFTGDLQADAYTGYDALYARGRIREIACWAHARRGFVEALTTDVRAALMVALIQQLYQVERAGADLEADARRVLRQAESIPVLAKIAAEREQLACTVLPKSPLGDALRYLTNQWAALQRFTEDGRLAIDNNRAENQLRVVALGRRALQADRSGEGVALRRPAHRPDDDGARGADRTRYDRVRRRGCRRQHDRADADAEHVGRDVLRLGGAGVHLQQPPALRRRWPARALPAARTVVHDQRADAAVPRDAGREGPGCAGAGGRRRRQRVNHGVGLQHHPERDRRRPRRAGGD